MPKKAVAAAAEQLDDTYRPRWTPPLAALMLYAMSVFGFSKEQNMGFWSMAGVVDPSQRLGDAQIRSPLLLAQNLERAVLLEEVVGDDFEHFTR